jgi:predicted membrane metal-binding protein
LLESHISYPLLCYFRSQHNNQSWLSALTAILDTSALLISGIRGPEARQAQLTFAMARHAVIDLAQNFALRPASNAPDRLPPAQYQKLFDALCGSGVNVCHDNLSSERLREMRQLYEGYLQALSNYLEMPLPPWLAQQPHKDNWQTVARLRAQTEGANAASSNERVEENPRIGAFSTQIDHHHDF